MDNLRKTYPKRWLTSTWQFLALAILVSLFVSCSKSGIEELGETIADDLNNGPLGKETVDLPKEEEEKDSTENEKDETDDEKDETDDEGKIIGSITAEVNGQPFKTPKIPQFVFATDIAIYGEFYYFYIFGIDVELGLKKSRHITLLLAGNNFTSLEKGKVWNEPYTDLFLEGASGGYSENIEVDESADGNNDEDYSGLLDAEDLESIYVTITAIDHEKGIISGEFSFKGTSKVTGQTYDITDGKFTDIEFRVPKD